MALDEGNVLALNNLAWLLAWQRRRAPEALMLVNRAIALRGPLGGLLDTRAVIYLALADPERALLDMKQALAQQATASRYLHLAQVFWRLDQPITARNVFDRAVAAQLALRDLHPLERAAYLELLESLNR